MLNRLVVIGAVVAASALVAMGVLGAGVASAKPPYYGQTYARAAEKVQSQGGTPAIATVIGSLLPTDDCIVTNAYRSKFHRGTTMFELNCNLGLAQPGKPGNSVMTPQGQWNKALQQKASNISNDFQKAMAAGKAPYCDSNTERCQQICDQSGTCSHELLKYLAGL